MSSILSDIQLPPLSLRDMASILQEVTTPQTAEQDTQNGTPAGSTPTPTPPPAVTQNDQTPTATTEEQPKETATKEKEKGKEETQVGKEEDKAPTTTTTSQTQETPFPSPTAPSTTTDGTLPSDPTASSTETDTPTTIILNSNILSDSLSSTLFVVSVTSGSILLPSTILVASNGNPLTVSQGTQTRTSAMYLPGIVTGNGSPTATAGSSSQQLGGMDASSSSSTQSRGPGAGAVFGFVALACVLVMAILLAMKKVSAYRASSRMPLCPDSERGGKPTGVGGGSRGIRSSRGWTALGSPMSRASSWFGVEGGGGLGGGSGSQSEKMVYGKSRDSSLYLAGTNRAGLGTSTVSQPSPIHHYTPYHHGRQPSLPAMPSRAALASSPSAKPSPFSPLNAYLVTYDEPSNDHYIPAPSRPTLSPLSTSSSSSHSPNNKYTNAPPPTPTAGSVYEELSETGAPLNTSAYPSTEDLLSTATSYQSLDPRARPNHRLDPTTTPSRSRNGSFGSSIGNLGVPSSSRARPNSDASTYSSEGYFGDQHKVEGHGYVGVEKGRLYDAVMRHGGGV